jgi:hypothetical protein
MTFKAIRDKGKRAEKEAARRIARAGLGKATRTPGSGNGKIKDDVFCNLPFGIEVKNERQTNFLPNIDQAKEQARIGNIDPNKWCLVTIDPRGVQDPERMTMYATVEYDEFLNLLKKFSEPKIKEPDRELKYKLESLKESCRRLENTPEDKWEIKSLKRKCSEVIKLLKI